MSDFGDFDDALYFHQKVMYIVFTIGIMAIILGFIVCIVCVLRFRRNSNPGAIFTSPAVVITSQQHYPAARPNVVVTPIVYAPVNNGYQQMQLQQQQQQLQQQHLQQQQQQQQQRMPATAPPMQFGQSSQDPPSYQEATYFQQESFNPEFRKQ